MASLDYEIQASDKAAHMQEEQDVLCRSTAGGWTDLAGTVCDQRRVLVSLMQEERAALLLTRIPGMST